MADIISYFGTYKPAADGAVASFKFEYLCTLGFAAIVIFLGRAIVARSAGAQKIRDPGACYFRSDLLDHRILHQGCRNRRNLLRRDDHEGSLPELILPLRRLRLQRKDVKTCGRKALCPDRIRGMSPDHLPGPLRLRPEPAASECIRSWLSSALPQRCPAALALRLPSARSLKSWGAARRHRCRCCGRYHGKYHGLPDRRTGGSFPDRKARFKV